jgi:hypothetical protein
MKRLDPLARHRLIVHAFVVAAVAVCGLLLFVGLPIWRPAHAVVLPPLQAMAVALFVAGTLAVPAQGLRLLSALVRDGRSVLEIESRDLIDLIAFSQYFLVACAFEFASVVAGR